MTKVYLLFEVLAKEAETPASEEPAPGAEAIYNYISNPKGRRRKWMRRPCPAGRRVGVTGWHAWLPAAAVGAAMFYVFSKVFSFRTTFSFFFG